MKFIKIGTEMFEELKSLQKDYKVAIGEDVPSETELKSLRNAIEQGHIHFYGCICNESLVAYAFEQSEVSSLTVGCADCDVEMYQAIGFQIPLGNMLAYGGEIC